MPVGSKMVHNVDEAVNTGTVAVIEEERTYKANATIAAGEAVAIEAGVDVYQVILADVADAACCVGIAMEAAVAGGTVKVLRRGVWPTCVCLTGVAVDDVLYTTATAGALDGTGEALADAVPVGVAMTGVSGLTCSAWISAPF